MRLNRKEVLASPSRNTEAQTAEIVCRDRQKAAPCYCRGRWAWGPCLGSAGPSFSQRQHQARGSRSPDLCCVTANILLPSCRTQRILPVGISATPMIVRRPPHSFCGLGGALHSYTGGDVSHSEQFPPAVTSLQRAKGSMQQALLYNERTVESAVRNAQGEEPAMGSGHTDDVSGVPLEHTGGFVPSFTPSSTESWCLQQRKQTCLGRYLAARVIARMKVITMIIEAVMTL